MSLSSAALGREVFGLDESFPWEFSTSYLLSASASKLVYVLYPGAIVAMLRWPVLRGHTHELGHPLFWSDHNDLIPPHEQEDELVQVIEVALCDLNDSPQVQTD